MVRVNLVDPTLLSDQHLIAEYNEILMLMSYIKKSICFDDVPKDYCLGKGHMKFFKNKVIYLKKRHELIRKEMKNRGFKIEKQINFEGLNKRSLGNWIPSNKDFKIIVKRILEKIDLRPGWYRYYGEKKDNKFFNKLLNKLR